MAQYAHGECARLPKYAACEARCEMSSAPRMPEATVLTAGPGAAPVRYRTRGSPRAPADAQGTTPEKGLARAGAVRMIPPRSSPAPTARTHARRAYILVCIGSIHTRPRKDGFAAGPGSAGAWPVSGVCTLHLTTYFTRRQACVRLSALVPYRNFT